MTTDQRLKEIQAELAAQGRTVTGRFVGRRIIEGTIILDEPAPAEDRRLPDNWLAQADSSEQFSGPLATALAIAGAVSTWNVSEATHNLNAALKTDADTESLERAAAKRARRQMRNIKNRNRGEP